MNQHIFEKLNRYENGGIILIVCAYIIIKYLKMPGHGFLDEKMDDNADSTVESLPIVPSWFLVSGSLRTVGGVWAGGFCLCFVQA